MRRTKQTRIEIDGTPVAVTRASYNLDKQARGYYRCDVKPKGGLPFRCWLRAATVEEAAKDALLRYEKTGVVWLEK